VLAVLVAGGAALLREQRATRARLEALAREVAASEARVAGLERELAEQRRQLAGQRDELAHLSRLTREARRDPERLLRVERRVQALASEAVAGERLIRQYGAGVALREATFTFADATGRAVRHAGTDPQGRPRRAAPGAPRMTVEGEGPLVHHAVLGTGFLVEREGAVLASRHLVEPAEHEDAFAAMLEQGWSPRLARVRAFFPDLAAAVPLEVVRVSRVADVALLRGPPAPAAVPVLRLDRSGRGAAPGRPVVLMGYPAGVDLLLARTDAAVRRAIMGEGGAEPPPADLGTLLDRLSRHHLIRPFVAWGHLVDVDARQLALDAGTAVGGSGGPVLSTDGQVIGILEAVTGDLDELRLGVPVRFAHALLRPREGP
jgi:S1-C subfamily serine protease